LAAFKTPLAGGSHTPTWQQKAKTHGYVISIFTDVDNRSQG
jgi:hypothetical protein